MIKLLAIQLDIFLFEAVTLKCYFLNILIHPIKFSPQNNKLVREMLSKFQVAEYSSFAWNVILLILLLGKILQ